MSRFNEIYDNIILESNLIASSPQKLVDYISNKLLDMKDNKQTTFDLLFSDIVKENLLDDWNDFNKQYIINKIQYLNDCKLELLIDSNEDDEFYGEFRPGKNFKDITKKDIELLIKDENINVLNNVYYTRYLEDELNTKQNQLFKDQQLLHKIDETLTTIKYFGSIRINEKYITKEETLKHHNLVEIVEHEIKHFIVLLLSVLKTNINYSRIYSKQIRPRKGKDIKKEIDNDIKFYNLDEDEFTTLFGTYCDWLIRFFKHYYKDIKNIKYTEKEIKEFINGILEVIFYNKTNQYSNELKQYKNMWSKISRFYKEISEDSKEKSNVNKPFTKDKYNKLLKWTYANFKRNLKV